MTNVKRGNFRIGTSGIVVPGSKESFPEEFQLKSRLNYYSSLFNTLEVNSTFKKLPLSSTLVKWSNDVAETFQLTLKLWKEITHVKELNTDLNNIDIFFNVANKIGNKKGCLLIQFPGKVSSEYYDNVEQILLRLQLLDTNNEWRKAVEFRSITWYQERTYDLLDQHRTTLVLHDMPKSNNLAITVRSDFYYFRYHGTKGDYRGSYSNDFLLQQSEKIRNCLSEGKDVYAYFNNTMGSAFDNAMTLRQMVER
ncbi:MAG: hypothetical protein JWR18_141 [Segetibacter sp.]|jgi:uncharacterized protein YecE (DUF72 family)|nr:hypothetical protein [Segetibacter sp.]